MLNKGQKWGEAGDIYFTSCPGSVGPPGTSQVKAVLEQSGSTGSSQELRMAGNLSEASSLHQFSEVQGLLILI